MTLQQRIDAYADAIRICNERLEQEKRDLQWNYDQLMQAEAEVIGKAHGWENVTLSGMVSEGKNVYVTPTAERSAPTITPRAPRSESMASPGDLEEMGDPKPLEEPPPAVPPTPKPEEPPPAEPPAA